MSKNCMKNQEQENIGTDASQAGLNEQAGNGIKNTGETDGADIPEQETEDNAEEQSVSIEDRLAESEAAIARLTDQNLRQMAEFDNYRKRTMKEKAELIRNASADVITKILPIIDDMERAIENSAKSDDINAIREGEQLIYSKLMHILEGEGLKKIQTKGEQFNTDIHEAVAIIPASEDNAKNTIIDCTRDGYLLNDKLLRAAQVVVAN